MEQIPKLHAQLFSSIISTKISNLDTGSEILTKKGASTYFNWNYRGQTHNEGIWGYRGETHIDNMGDRIQ